MASSGGRQFQLAWFIPVLTLSVFACARTATAFQQQLVVQRKHVQSTYSVHLCKHNEGGIQHTNTPDHAHTHSRSLQVLGSATLVAVLFAQLAEAQLPVTTATISDPSIASGTLDAVLKRAFGGGVAGAAAGAVQVLTLMWLRTCMNYQYRYGGTLGETLRQLYSEGGLARFYQGFPLALLQGPLSRFGDTAANAGILALFAAYNLDTIPVTVRTAACSLTAGIWRILLTPLDVTKTSLQVNGREGFTLLYQKLTQEGVGVLFAGAFASSAATFVGHYPWFLTFNALNNALPTAESLHAVTALAHVDLAAVDVTRNAIIGFSASFVSDCASNSLRVLKTTKQTSETTISYSEAVQRILKADGWEGLLGRGLRTRLLVNGIQGVMFTVLWKYFERLLSS